jgi:hypothetical protein
MAPAKLAMSMTAANRRTAHPQKRSITQPLRRGHCPGAAHLSEN